MPQKSPRSLMLAPEWSGFTSIHLFREFRTLGVNCWTNPISCFMLNPNPRFFFWLKGGCRCRMAMTTYSKRVVMHYLLMCIWVFYETTIMQLTKHMSSRALLCSLMANYYDMYKGWNFVNWVKFFYGNNWNKSDGRDNSWIEFMFLTTHM